jgi:hypothetical protein
MPVGGFLKTTEMEKDSRKLLRIRFTKNRKITISRRWSKAQAIGGSLDEPRPHLRRWDRADFSSPEPLVTMACDKVVARVTNSPRNDP